MRNTEEDCYDESCDGTFVRENTTKYCNECYRTPYTSYEPRNRDAWQSFWSYREKEYEGTYGRSRKKCVGGFEGPWFENGSYNP